MLYEVKKPKEIKGIYELEELIIILSNIDKEEIVVRKVTNKSENPS